MSRAFLHIARIFLLILGGILLMWGALCLLSGSSEPLQSLQAFLWGVGFIAVSLLLIWAGLRLGRRAGTDSADGLETWD